MIQDVFCCAVTSVLARAVRGLGALERIVGNVGALGAADPNVRDRIFLSNDINRRRKIFIESICQGLALIHFRHCIAEDANEHMIVNMSRSGNSGR